MKIKYVPHMCLVLLNLIIALYEQHESKKTSYFLTLININSNNLKNISPIRCFLKLDMLLIDSKDACNFSKNEIKYSVDTNLFHFQSFP